MSRRHQALWRIPKTPQSCRRGGSILLLPRSVHYSPAVEMGGEPLRSFTALGQVKDTEVFSFDMGRGFGQAQDHRYGDDPPQLTAAGSRQLQSSCESHLDRLPQATTDEIEWFRVHAPLLTLRI